jgi:hypothetical protein
MRPPTDIGASMKGVAMTSLDLWAHFCAAADSSEEIVGSSTAKGTVATVA